ncbi:MAG: SurA N-terminal domain-containing protein [Gammaproteobacteria bacterium]|nr:SurA N-terminal domain-containing protein [Gammaproteobacteria bacterium]
MLQSIRDRSQGWIVYTIVGLIVLTFALWGVQEYLGLNEQPAVATVDDVKITQNQYQRALQQQRQRFQSMLGSNYDPSLFDTPAVRRNILEELINDAVLMKFVEDSGMRVGEKQIAQMIVSFPQFQQDGKFSDALFENYLITQGLDQENFFYRLANDIKREQVFKGVASSAFKTEYSQIRESKLLGQKRDIGYMVFNSSDNINKIDVTDEQINEYYSSHGNEFMSQEEVSVDYIDLSMQQLAKQITVSNKEVRDFYEQNKSLYVAEERRRASHILLELSPDANEATEIAVKDKAENILERAKAGESFEALAKEFSQDPGSAQQGGDLGYFTTGVMTKPFEEAVFGLDEGEISQPVRTEFGFHIIKLTGIQREEKAFDEVKDKVRQELKRREAERQYYDLSERMANIAYETVDNIEVVADEVGLNVQTTGLFTRNDPPGIMADKKLRETVFNRDVLENRHNEVVELGPEHTVVFRVTQYNPARVKPLSAVRDQIVKTIKRNRATEMSRQDAQAAIVSIREGKSPSSVAKDYDTKWIDKGLHTRMDAGKVDRNLLQAAFTLAKTDLPTYSVTTLSNGDSAVVSVTEVIDGEGSLIKSDEQLTREQQQAGALAFQMLIEHLKLDMDIVRNNELLQ